MKTVHRSILIIVVLFVLSIVATALAEVYKWKWMLEWVAPLLPILLLIAIASVASRQSGSVHEKTSTMREWILGAAVIVLVICFLEIEIVADTPVNMKFLGLLWTMSGEWATRLLSSGGFVIGLFTAWIALKESCLKGTKGTNAETQVAAS